MKLYEFYKRNPEILEDMIKASQNREVAYVYESGNYGKRPFVLENETDILNLVRQGVVSFHMSIERWSNPLMLMPGIKRKELKELRIGWDLVIDIDAKDFEYSKYTAHLIIKFLRNYGISKIYIKYSGGKGFHIVVPWEVLPKEIEDPRTLEKKNTKELFPDIARLVISFIAAKIEKDLEKYILSRESVEEIIKKYNLNILPEQFSPFHIVEIDSILISVRHLIRMPYSLNEKTGLLSIPIEENEILKFEKEKASLDYYEYEGIPFLNEKIEEKPEAEKLFKDAIIWNELNRIEKERIKAIMEETVKEKEKSEEEIIEKEIKVTIKKFKGKVPFDYFPPCIKKMLQGLEDGRKRAIFILINFLVRMGYSWDEINQIIWEWNEKNPEPLRERYVEYQLEWHKKRYEQNKGYLTPRCSHPTYYKDMGVCQPDEICKLIKNPLQYPYMKIKIEKGKKENK